MLRLLYVVLRNRLRETVFFMPKKQNIQTICFHDCINKLTKHTTMSFYFTVFICGSNSALRTLFSSEKGFTQLWKKYLFLSLYYYLINIVNKKIRSLNFYSKTT